MRADLARRGAFAGLALALGALAAGCGGSQRAIRVAYISDCTSPFSAFSEQSLAGAELPFIQRGARLRRHEPSVGVVGGSIDGRRIELLLGCESYGDFTSVLAELRRVVEDEGADIVVGPSNQGEGLVIKRYAKQHRNITFSTASAEQSTTLKDPAPNLFRFTIDAAQLSAGLGVYAYRTLGWRNAVTVGEDDPAGWPEVAGFVAEFCALGGNVVKRLWAPGSVTDFRPIVARIPTRGVDGVVLPSPLQPARSFMAAWRERQPDLGRRLLVSSVAFGGPLTDRMLGLVGVANWPWVPTAALHRYLTDFARAFPGQQSSFFASQSYDSMEPVFEALEEVHGDLSHSERRFQAALARLTFDAPNGVTRLDRRHQAIAPTYLGLVERSAQGTPVVRQIRIQPSVEQTFGGYFSPLSPPPSRTQPACRHGDPPPWAGSAR